MAIYAKTADGWTEIGASSGGGELPGVGGWATVTEVKGKGTKYEYPADGVDWVAFEWTDDGSVTTTDGLVDMLVVGAGGTAGNFGPGAGGFFIDGVQKIDATTHAITIGPNFSADQETQGATSVGTIRTPAGYSRVGNGADTGPGTGTNGMHTSHITGVAMQVSGISTNRGGGGAYSGGNEVKGQPGLAVIRVPRSSDLSGLPAGAFDEPVTLAPGLEGAGPEVPEAPEPEEGGALFSRTYTLNSDPSTEPGLVYPSTNYIKLNREDALVWQENVEDGVDILCELPPDGNYPGYRRRYFNLYYYVPQTGSSKLKFYDGYDGSIPSYVDKSYTLTAYPAGQIPDDETLDAASAQAAAVEAKPKRSRKKAK